MPSLRHVASRLEDRVRAVELRMRQEPRPRVLCLEWLDPPYSAGHWVPEMVEVAGGGSFVGAAGEAAGKAGLEGGVVRPAGGEGINASHSGGLFATAAQSTTVRVERGGRRPGERGVTESWRAGGGGPEDTARG